MGKTHTRIETEQRITRKMMSIYCKSHHGRKELCNTCTHLLYTAHQKLEKCHWGENKPTCFSCSTHCWSGDDQQKIKEVMRFSGPRMLLYHPIDVIIHLIHQIKA